MRSTNASAKLTANSQKTNSGLQESCVKYLPISYCANAPESINKNFSLETD